jgi:hypothetical protein
MRKTARGLLLGFFTLLTSAVVGVGSAFMSALALGAATALIVPGTGTPNANIVTDYLQHAADRYIAPFDPSCTSTNGCDLQGINYPASFFPLVIFPGWCRSGPGGCDTWNDSVGTGVANLDTALRTQLAQPCPATGCDPIILFGYSQGGAVVSDELRNIGDLTAAEKSRLSVVMIGNAYNPDGGIFTRLGFLPTIPFLNVTFGPPMPTNTGVPITSIGFQYDPVMYAPKYWGNPFALLNALAAFETVHGFYLTPNGNGPTDPIAYGYTAAQLQAAITNPANARHDSSGNTYVMIPALSLPIADFIMSEVPAALQPVVKPFVDLVSPAWKVLADLGYDWSGNPGTPSTLSILPFNPIQNWPAVGVNLVAAGIQGIQAFIGDLGGVTSLLTPAVTPATTPTVSTLAVKSAPAAKTTTAATEQVSEVKTSPPTLTVVKNTTEQKAKTSTDVKTDTTPTADTTKPATKPDATTKPAETKPSGTAAGDKKDTKKKTDTAKKPATDKKDADKKAADSGKAAA